MSILRYQFVFSSPPAPHSQAHTPILHLCISIPALEIGSSAPTIHFLFVPTNTYYVTLGKSVYNLEIREEVCEPS